jgi:16S rRNA G966 N2-methylase RsmD
VYREDVGRRLSADDASGRRYDLVLVDPPYRMLSRFLPMLATHLPSVVASDGLVVVESEAKEEPELPLPLRTSRRYGSTRVSLFEGTE